MPSAELVTIGQVATRLVMACVEDDDPVIDECTNYFSHAPKVHLLVATCFWAETLLAMAGFQQGAGIAVGLTDDEQLSARPPEPHEVLAIEIIGAVAADDEDPMHSIHEKWLACTDDCSVEAAMLLLGEAVKVIRTRRVAAMN